MPSVISSRTTASTATHDQRSSGGHVNGNDNGHGHGNASNAGSTAVVLEYICLFTHDLKRKQKRWQDGRVKYHTFNKRVMVYDQRGNFVGDMHWRRDWEFAEGEELELERGGVIVQVCECVGRQDQDLSELLDKRAKEKEERQAKAASRPPSVLRPPHNPPLHRPSLPTNSVQSRHRPLLQVIGTPTGHHGRALVPTESPFEQRQRADATPESRPSKRPKRDITPPSKMGYAQSLFGAPLTLSGAPMSSAPLRRSVAPTKQPRHEAPSSPREQDGNLEVMNDPEDDNVISSSHLNPPRLRNNAKTTSHSHSSGSCSPVERGQPPAVVANLERIGSGRRESGVERNDGRTTSSYFGKGPNAQGSDQSMSPPESRRRKHTSVVMSQAATKGLKTLSRQRGSLGERAPVARVAAPIDTIVIDDDMDDLLAASETPPRRETELTSAGKGNLDFRKRPPVRNRESPIPPPTALRDGATDKVQRADMSESGVKDGETRAEKRTELRIKPRQKRGLLVASEFQRAPTKRPKRTKPPDDAFVRKRPKGGAKIATETAAEEIDLVPPRRLIPSADNENPFLTFSAALLPPPQHKGNSCVASSSVTKADRGPGPVRMTSSQPSSNEGDATYAGSFASVQSMDSMDSPVEDSPQGWRQDEAENAVLDADTASDSASEPFSTMPTTVAGRRVPVTRGRTKRKQGVEEDLSRNRDAARGWESPDEELPQVPVGPRLARLSRRSVKSKEVIGLIVFSSSPVEDAPSPPKLPSDDGSVGVVDSDTGDFDLAATMSRGTSTVAMHRPFRGAEDQALTVDTLYTADVASVGPGNDPSLRRQEPLPETGCLASACGLGGEGAKEERPIADGALQRLSRFTPGGHRPAVATGGNGSLKSSPVPAVADQQTYRMYHDRADLPDAGGRPIDEAGSSANRADGLQAPSYKAADLPERRLNPTNTTCGLREPACAPDDATGEQPSGELPAAEMKNPPPRIVNPATRGRKAALKSHAAGQVPQSILPPPEPLPARSMMRSVLDARQDPSTNERPKRKMTFPGFVSAKVGGPWSREAHDLLETGRPSS